MYSKFQRIAAEFVGTSALIFFGAGSICADQFLKATNQGSLGLLGIAVAHGLAIGIMVTAVGHISGGHLNPAVTIGFWVTRKISTFEAVLYWLAQLAGGVAAAYLLRLVVPEDTWQLVKLGTPALGGLSHRGGMVLEGIMTFFLVFVVFATAADERGAFGKIAGFAIGLTVTMGILMGGPFTGAAMNPARSFGPALASQHWATTACTGSAPLAAACWPGGSTTT